MTLATDATRTRLEIAIARAEIDDDLAAQIKALIAKGISQTAASGFISLVESLPQSTGAVKRPERENRVQKTGYYSYGDGLVAKVQRSKKGHLYACEQRPGGQWKFISGLISQLDNRDEVEAPAPIAASRADIEDALRRASA